MSEDKNQMLSAMPFNARCPILSQERKRAKALCHSFNTLHPDEKGKRQQVLSRLFAQSFKPHIEPNFYCDYGYNIQLGHNFFANHNCTFLDAAPIVIGDNVMLGPSVNLATTEHPLPSKQRLALLTCAKPITIGDNVWLGMGVQVLPGVSIGDNTVIAAGSVVCCDIANNCLAAGVPAKVIRSID